MKDILGFEGLYAITSDGRVWAYADIPNGGYFRKFGGDGRYNSVVLSKRGRTPRTILVHRLVAQAFVPNPAQLPMVHHINGDKKDNRAENLMWVNHRTNVAYHRVADLNCCPTCGRAI
ncbi:MAG: HNH endonuclease signature motif containing protein [Xanthobacteraceae bacterium]